MEKGKLDSFYLVLIIIILVFICQYYATVGDIYIYKLENQFSIQDHRTEANRIYFKVEDISNDIKLSIKLSHQRICEAKYRHFIKKYPKHFGSSDGPLPMHYYVYTIYDILAEMNRLQGNIADHLRRVQDTSERMTHLESLLQDLLPPVDQEGGLITTVSFNNISAHDGDVRSTEETDVQASAGHLGQDNTLNITDQDGNTDRQREETQTASPQQDSDTQPSVQNMVTYASEQHMLPRNTDREAEAFINASEHDRNVGSTEETDVQASAGYPRQDNTLNTTGQDGIPCRQREETNTASPQLDSDMQSSIQNTDTYASEQHMLHRNTNRQAEENYIVSPQQEPNMRPSLINTLTSASEPRAIQSNTVTSLSRMPYQNSESDNTQNHTTRNIDVGRNTLANPCYISKSTRMSSYQRCPLRSQTPEEMADAGFYYTGISDTVRCFDCGIGFRNWETDHDPWVEHARWSPNCTHVLHSKGQDFIDLIRQFTRIPETLQQETPVTRQRDAALNIGDARRQQRLQRILRFPLQSEAAQEAIHRGYTPRVVKEAIEILVSNYGWQWLSAELLLEILDDLGASRNQQGANCIDNIIDRRDAIEENRRLREQYICKICLDGEVKIVFLPCGHLCCCAQCAPAFRECPICRQHIKGTVRVYTPK